MTHAEWRGWLERNSLPGVGKCFDDWTEERERLQAEMKNMVSQDDCQERIGRQVLRAEKAEGEVHRLRGGINDVIVTSMDGKLYCKLY